MSSFNTSVPAATDIVALQRLGSITDCRDRYRLHRGKIYALAREHPGLLKRLFGRTLVDFAVMDEIINNLPDYRAAPAGQRGHLVNLPESGRLSKPVQAARARKAAAAAVKA